MLDLPDYNWGSLCWRETRIVYLHGELVLDDRERELRDQGMGVEQIARILCKLRSDLRCWTRTLMIDRRQAADLDTGDPNPTFEELVAKWEGRRVEGRLVTGDERYEKIIEGAKKSRGSVNDMFGLDPKHPPPLPLVVQPSPTYARPCPNSATCALATAGPTGCSNYKAA
jgi:hypothetical protein